MILLTLLLFIAYPVIFLYAQNYSSVALLEQGHIVLWVIGFSVCIAALSQFFGKNKDRVMIFAAISYLMLFSYGHVRSFFDIDLIILYQKYIVLLWVLISFVLAGLIIYKVNNVEKLKKFLLIFTLIISANPLFVILHESLTGFIGDTTENAVKHHEERLAGFEDMPDVYYIILDGYARSDILSDIYDYDNSKILEYLEEVGFYVADKSASNYSQTTLSLASSLNLDYVQNIVDQDKSLSRVDMQNKISENRVAEMLRDIDYTYAVFTSGYWWTQVSTADIFVKPESSLSEFENQLLSLTPVPDLSQSYSTRSLYEKRREHLNFAFEHIPDMSEVEGPVFAFAHIVAPHPPFVFDAEGGPIEPIGRPFSFWDGSWFLKLGGTKEEYLHNYIGQVEYVNNNLEILIDSILFQSETAPIIIIQADHGPGSQVDFDVAENSNFKERHSIFNAYYFPERKGYDQLYEGITPVNSFRVVFNTFFGTNYNYLNDSSYFSTYSNMFNYLDVTDDVNK